MKQFLVTLPRNLIGCFTGRRIIWHLIAIVFTFILVMSGFDWRYFLVTRNPELRYWMWPAVVIGMFLPVCLPFIVLVVGFIARNAKVVLTGFAIGQAEIIGALITAACKAFTGRVHPPHDVGTDISHVFHFGFLRGGVFWGWPSSHTTVAFAMAVTVCTLWPKRWWLGFPPSDFLIHTGLPSLSNCEYVNRFPKMEPTAFKNRVASFSSRRLKRKACSSRYHDQDRGRRHHVATSVERHGRLGSEGEPMN
ncbi:MAG TPA: phosphatase PAP2 family protein [Verrucomicrobiae bacterium]|nr:phosphatase PAP2 family protein [Verrucomicrobiae bacterium]